MSDTSESVPDLEPDGVAAPGEPTALEPAPIEPVPAGYPAFLADLKERVRAAQLRAALSVNRELLLLYWQVGRDLAGKQDQEGWGAGVVERVARDLSAAFPGVAGFSARNLWRMRAFARAYPEVLPPPVAQIPWAHNVILLEKLKGDEPRLWYARQALERGWSRNVLALQIEGRLRERQGAAPTNFPRTLPPSQSDLARQALKDPYVFDFLTLGDEAQERDLERGLLDHLRRFLLELGAGFAFLGSQYHLRVGDSDFYLDLLFYHVRLHCYVVVDLKMGRFTPADAGQLNFYLSAADDLLRAEGDGPTIGLLLCKGKDETVAEYALRDVGKPMGIAEFRLSDALPDSVRGSLPTVEELEAELGGAGDASSGDGPPDQGGRGGEA